MRPRGADSAAKLYIHERKEAEDLGPNETHKLHEESSFFSSHYENDCTDYQAARAWTSQFFGKSGKSSFYSFLNIIRPNSQPLTNLYMLAVISFVIYFSYALAGKLLLSK